METAFQHYQFNINQQRNTRRTTDKRLAQRDIRNLNQIEILKSNKLDLVDMDKNLIKLNPHQYNESNYVNKRIINLEIENGLKKQEDADQLDQFLLNKSNAKYTEYSKLLDIAKERSADNHLFQSGKKRQEETKMPPNEFANQNKYNFGSLKSALKTSSYVTPDDEPSTQIVDSTIIDPQSFIKVFAHDSTLKPELIKQVYPNIKLDQVVDELNIEHHPTTLLKRQSMLLQHNQSILPPQESKVKFNDTAKVYLTKLDDYFEDDTSIFRNAEQLEDSIKYAQTSDKQSSIKIDIPSQDIVWDVGQWSQNEIQYYNNPNQKNKSKNTTAPQVEQNNHYKFIKNQRYNNIYLNSIIKKDLRYYAGGNQADSIESSLRSLQDLKFHHHNRPEGLDIQPKVVPTSVLEGVQQESDKLQEKYMIQNLEDESVFANYKQEMDSLDRQLKGVQYKIEQPIIKLTQRFNSNQLDPNLQQNQPNFNGVKAMKYEQFANQFTTQPKPNKQYTDIQKDQFKYFYTNIQNPLDILHQASDTYQQAIETEQNYLQEQLTMKSQFLIGPTPNPDFLPNQLNLYKPTQQDQKLYKAIGNMHKQMSGPNFQEMKRFRQNQLLQNVFDAREKYQYHFDSTIDE